MNSIKETLRTSSARLEASQNVILRSSKGEQLTDLVLASTMPRIRHSRRLLTRDRKNYCLPSLSRRLRIEWAAIPVTNCLLLTGTPLVASNVGAPSTRLVRGRHELDGDPVIADNGSGQVRPRCRATFHMTTNERRNEDLWQHDRILRFRNGRKKWLAPKNDPTRPPNGWSGRKETPHQGLKSLPSKRRPSCVRKSGKLE